MVEEEGKQGVVMIGIFHESVNGKSFNE